MILNENGEARCSQCDGLIQDSMTKPHWHLEPCFSVPDDYQATEQEVMESLAVALAFAAVPTPQLCSPECVAAYIGQYAEKLAPNVRKEPSRMRQLSDRLRDGFRWN